MKKFREVRRKGALERQAERAARTPQQQLAKLDAMFGSGLGATKERAKLAKLIEGKKEVEAEKKAEG